MVKVVLGNPAQITRRSPQLRGVDSISMSRSIYQKLGSLVKNKTLVDDYNNGNLPSEYIRIVDELNNLFLKKNYPGIHGGLEIEEGIEELDEYLGSLGNTQVYSYSKDFVNIAPWIDPEVATAVRILTDESDNTYLVDGNEVLVQYN